MPFSYGCYNENNLYFQMQNKLVGDLHYKWRIYCLFPNLISNTLIRLGIQSQNVLFILPVNASNNSTFC